jgi:RNA polymerase sigma-70 factor, ECF subfamily
LLKTARHQLINAYRAHLVAEKRSVLREVDLVDCDSACLARVMASESYPSHHLRQQESNEYVRTAIDRLPPADREVLTMRHVEGYDYNMIAIIIDAQPDTVRQRYGRALLKLRKQLQAVGLIDPS